MSLQVNIGGRPVGSRLSEFELIQAGRDEKNDSIVEDAVRDQSSGYQHLGELAPRRNADGSLSITVTEDHLKQNVRAARERRSTNSPVVPVFYFEDEYGETHWFLNHDDALMGQAGYLCFDVEFGTGCLSWQKDSDTHVCDPISGPSCKRKRNRI